MPPIDLSSLPDGPVTRFAPSPTGRLHLGHVANAVWVWGIARARGGRVLLRIEDHDRSRCRPEYQRALLEDLEWLGLVPDDPPVRELAAGGASSYRQQDNDAAYRDAIERLAGRTSLYWCRCTRKTIAREVGLSEAPGFEELRYPGICRHWGLTEGPGRGLRAVLPAAPVSFADLRHGMLTQVPVEQCGDLLLRDGRGQWTYQFSVVVDDLRHGVDLVIRGDDLLESTGRQLALRALLAPALPPPRFLHHPLIFGADPAVKLSKRDRAAGLAELRSAGWTPGEVFGEAARLTGLADADTPVEPDRLADLFR